MFKWFKKKKLKQTTSINKNDNIIKKLYELKRICNDLKKSSDDNQRVLIGIREVLDVVRRIEKVISYLPSEDILRKINRKLEEFDSTRRSMNLVIEDLKLLRNANPYNKEQ